MKIAVVGAGAMGSIYAGLLADAGNEVWAIDTWQAHVDAIRERGLRVEGASGDRTVAVKASMDTADAGPCDAGPRASSGHRYGHGPRRPRSRRGDGFELRSYFDVWRNSASFRRAARPSPPSVSTLPRGAATPAPSDLVPDP